MHFSKWHWTRRYILEIVVDYLLVNWMVRIIQNIKFHFIFVSLTMCMMRSILQSWLKSIFLYFQDFFFSTYLWHPSHSCAHWQSLHGVKFSKFFTICINYLKSNAAYKFTMIPELANLFFLISTDILVLHPLTLESTNATLLGVPTDCHQYGHLLLWL